MKGGVCQGGYPRNEPSPSGCDSHRMAFCACLCGVRERVVEGIESFTTVDGQLEAAPTRIVNGHRHRVFLRMPEQQNVDAVALAGSELQAGPRCAGCRL